MKPLYKRTIIYWSEENPSHYSLQYLAQKVSEDEVFKSYDSTVKVENPERDPDFGYGYGEAFFTPCRDDMIDQLVDDVVNWDLDVLIEIAQEARRNALLDETDDAIKCIYKEDLG